MERSFRFGRWKWLIINGRFHTPRGISFRFVPFRSAKLTTRFDVLRAVCQRASGAGDAAVAGCPVVGRTLPGRINGVKLYLL